ncbi:hypothetical protein BKI52_12255 [marine bacterium AO1-C]|nr:hypothetical protein BKI52_12255 [marine bacterium AO1-C]
MELVGLLILLYLGLCFYTLFIWVTLLNRLRQKKYVDAFFRSIGFLFLMSIASFPVYIDFSIESIAVVCFLLISASAFSSATPRTKLQNGIKVTPYQPITLEEINDVVSPQTTSFSPKALIAPHKVKLLEKQSEHLWSNYESTLTARFWDDYEKVLIQMKSLNND